MRTRLSTMQILNTIAAMRAACLALRKSGRSVALVPTMGALHAGHLSLVHAARAGDCDGRGSVVAVSIFVNPAQFGPNEDYAQYPRTFDADCALLADEGVELVFAPSASEMYPEGFAATSVQVGEISQRLDGASRPSHFSGVATVVAKLLNIVEPRQAFFGQKDAAQVAVLCAMVRDLNFPVELVVCPIVREPDGLAMSSRNVYLSAAERQQALLLSRSLQVADSLVAGGETRAAVLIEAALSLFATEPALRIDYVAAVNPLTLEAVPNLCEDTLFAVAAYAGKTRLIDNILISRGRAEKTRGVSTLHPA